MRDDRSIKSRAGTPMSPKDDAVVEEAADLSGFFDESEEAYPMSRRR